MHNMATTVNTGLHNGNILRGYGLNVLAHTKRYLSDVKDVLVTKMGAYLHNLYACRIIMIYTLNNLQFGFSTLP